MEDRRATTGKRREVGPASVYSKSEFTNRPLDFFPWISWRHVYTMLHRIHTCMMLRPPDMTALEVRDKKVRSNLYLQK